MGRSRENTTKPIAGTHFHILLALVDEPRYGLGIVEEVARRTEGEVRLGPGTLYTAIKKMCEDGLIDEREQVPTASGTDPRRRYYGITPLGRDILQAQAIRLAQYVEVARAKHVLAE